MNAGLTSELATCVLAESFDARNVTMQVEYLDGLDSKAVCAEEAADLVLADVRSVAAGRKPVAGGALPLRWAGTSSGTSARE